MKKSPGAYVYHPPGVELGGSKDSHIWKIIRYKNGESRFALELDAAKNKHDTQKYFK